MTNRNRQHRDSEQATPIGYTPTGHPSVEQLMAEQGTGPITDVSLLHGEFWPAEEPIEDFLATLDEWRGRRRSDPAA